MGSCKASDVTFPSNKQCPEHLQQKVLLYANMVPSTQKGRMHRTTSNHPHRVMGMKQSVCNPECKTEPYNNVTMNPINILFEISILKTAISKSTPPKTFHMVKKNFQKNSMCMWCLQIRHITHQNKVPE
jgi:hypothetical protein